MKIGKNYIIILIFVLFIISSIVFFLIINSSNNAIVSGIVAKNTEEGLTGEIGFQNVYANATVQIYTIKRAEIEGKIVDTVDVLYKETKTDKDGEFSVKVSPGIYQVKAFYGDNLISNNINIDAKLGRTTRVELELRDFSQ
jgi:hypothetical protein